MMTKTWKSQNIPRSKYNTNSSFSSCYHWSNGSRMKIQVNVFFIVLVTHFYSTIINGECWLQCDKIIVKRGLSGGMTTVKLEIMFWVGGERQVSHWPQIFRGASSSSRMGWLRKISLDLMHRPRTSASVIWTIFPGRLPRTGKEENVLFTFIVHC